MTDISVKKYLFCTYTYNFSLFRKEIEKHVQFRKTIRPSALQLEPLLKLVVYNKQYMEIRKWIRPNSITKTSMSLDNHHLGGINIYYASWGDLLKIKYTKIVRLSSLHFG